MESDSFFCQLFKQLPQTLFELIDLPATRADSYRFDSVEVKKSFRIDGLFVPHKRTLPFYIVEVQFRRVQKFYANLFAKVFWYLEENDPKQDWVAVAIFPSRKQEPRYLRPYECLLQSEHVRRIYLDELPMPADPSPGLGMLHLVSATPNQTRELVGRIVRKARTEYGDTDVGHNVIQLAEELLIRKFSDLGREEVRKMFHLEDLRKTRVWQEAHEEGIEKGREEGIEKGIEKGKTIAQKELVQNFLAQGMSLKQVAELMRMSVETVRRFAKDHPQ